MSAVSSQLIEDVYLYLLRCARATFLAHSYLYTAADPEDFAHEALETFMRRGLLEEYDPSRSKISTFFGVAWKRWKANKVRDLYRDPGRHQLDISTLEEAVPASTAPLSLETLEALVTAALRGGPVFPRESTIETIYGTLPLTEAVVIAAFASEFSTGEIGKMTSLPPATWYRCMAKMRERVREAF